MACSKIFSGDLPELTRIHLIKNIQQNLNYLSIKCSEFKNKQKAYDIKLSSIILQNLGQIFPYRLEYLSLALKFNIYDLQIFLNNSQNIFIKKLIIKNKLYPDCENILPCIKEYIMKEKRVSYLAMDTTKKLEDLFELKDEVKEFKFYSIQVMFYDNLYINFRDLMNELLY
ncbi:hypothetical protein C1646_769808 [Rhizophagus diaphanus]|nr:hypothetical protein C1646_769808 [Rhizophagus diaphanus] [Rhizophagus sp. MUCL 43196]